MIYFAQRQSDNAIKIGTTKCWRRRAYSLKQTFGETFILLAVCDGSHSRERSIHRRFASLCLGRELFRPAPELLSFILTEGRRWNGKDEVTTIVTMRGCEAFRAWLEEGAAYAGMDVPTLFRRATEWYAKDIGFPQPAPEL